jgi:hypothetical protein
VQFAQIWQWRKVDGGKEYERRSCREKEQVKGEHNWCWISAFRGIVANGFHAKTPRRKGREGGRRVGGTVMKVVPI